MTTTDAAMELVLTERHEGVLTITINRPAQRNAVSREVAVQLAAALDLLDSDPDVVGGCAHRCGRDVQRGHGPEGVRQRAEDSRSFPVVDSAGSPEPWSASR